jgi:hypothetical protein
MTLKEQLLKELEQAPDSLIEALLKLCQQVKTGQEASSGLRAVDGVERVDAQRDAVERLQAKMRETNPEGRSLVDELIAERRMAAEHE